MFRPDEYEGSYRSRHRKNRAENIGAFFVILLCVIGCLAVSAFF